MMVLYVEAVEELSECVGFEPASVGRCEIQSMMAFKSFTEQTEDCVMTRLRNCRSVCCS